MTRKLTAVLIAIAVVVTPILAMAVTLTDNEQAQCEQHGGCLIVPMDELKTKMQEVFARGHEAGRISCGNRT